MASNSILAKLAIQISANLAGFGQALTKGQRDLSSFIGGVQKVAGAVGLAFSASAIANFTEEISKLAGQAEGVSAAFQRLPNSTKLMQELKEATGGTVSELALMKRAVQASNFDISLKQLPKLLEFATLRAQQTGQSVDYLVDSIVTGIGRKSKLILDNLGISAVQLTAALGGASAQSVSIAKVTEAVGNIADKNLKNMARFSENASTKAERLAATWENVKVSLGNKTKGAIGAFYDLTNNVLNSLNSALNDQIAALTMEKTGLNTLVDAITSANTSEAARKTLIGELNAKYPKFLEHLNAEKVTNEQLAARMKEVNAQFERKILLSAAEGKFKDITEAIVETVDREANAHKTLAGIFKDSSKGAYEQAVIAHASELDIQKALTDRAALQKDLSEKMKAYDDALKIFNSTNNDYFTTTTKNAEATDNLADKLKELEKHFKFTPDLEAEGSQNPELRNDQARNQAIAFSDAMGQIATSADFAGGALIKLENTSANTTTNIAKQWMDLGPMIAGGLSEFAEGLGEAIVGVGDFGDTILKTLSGFMKSFGSALVALGVGKIALDAFGGPAMIAAGIALGAAGAAIGALSNGPRDIGVAPGHAPGVDVNIEGRIHGYDLALVTTKEASRSGRLG